MLNCVTRRMLFLGGLVFCACDKTDVASTAELFNTHADQDSLFSTNDEVVDSVKNVYALDNCTSERSGKISFVREENTFYLCDDGDWVESREDTKKVSSSSVAPFSSSYEENSSSENALELSSSSHEESSSSENALEIHSCSSEKMSSSQEKSSSSVYKSVKYDCATYKCVTTEYLNQEMLAAGKYGEYLDVRDSQVYRTIVIGSQTWMAQNLNYNYKVGGASYGNLCYESKSDNCSKYGKLYTWGAAMDSAGVFTDRGKGCGRGKTCSPSYTVRGICPEGWHLPDTTEWNALLKVVGGETGSAKKLKAANSWITGYMGTDDYGFSALPTGNCPSTSECVDITKSTDIWSSTEYSTLGAYYRYTFIDARTPNNMILDYQNKSTARPIRCVEGDSLLSSAKSSSSVAASSSSVAKSSSSIAASSSSEIKSSSSAASSSSVVTGKYDCSLYDCVTTEYLNSTMLAAGKYGEYLDTRDNQVYRTIEIGTQTWFAQNLNYVSMNSVCYSGDTANCRKFGRLYRQSEATEVCPTGWHLPSKAEWEKLVENKGSTKGEVALNLEYTGWNNAYDLYGFSVLPAGFKREDGNFFALGTQTLFWTSATSGDIGFMDEYFFTSNSTSYGFSVRCLKDEAQSTAISSSSAVAPKSSSSVSNAAARLFVDLGDEVYSVATSGQPVSVELVGMPDTSSLDYIAIYFEPNMSGSYARDLDIKSGKDEIYRIRQHMYASNKAPVVQENGYVTSFTPVVDMSTDDLDDRTVHYYWSGWTSGLGHFKIVFDRENLVFYLYVEDTYLGYGTLSNDPIVMDNIELAREQPMGTNTCEVSNVRVAGFSTLDAAKAWDGLAF